MQRLKGKILVNLKSFPAFYFLLTYIVLSSKEFFLENNKNNIFSDGIISSFYFLYFIVVVYHTEVSQYFFSLRLILLFSRMTDKSKQINQLEHDFAQWRLKFKMFHLDFQSFTVFIYESTFLWHYKNIDR